jgi:hypothetical protein
MMNPLKRRWLLGLFCLLVLCTSVWAGGRTKIAEDLTTNTTSTARPVPETAKSLYGQVVCTAGACTQTQEIYGDVDSDAANGILLCTLTLSGTTRAQDACPVVTATFLFYYVVTTATTGTAATGTVFAMY